MGIFGSATKRHLSKLEEEILFAQVAQEMINEEISPGLFAKAISDSGGDEIKAKALYIKKRVQMLKSERAAIIELENEQRREFSISKTSSKKIPDSSSTKESEVRKKFDIHGRRLIAGLFAVGGYWGMYGALKWQETFFDIAFSLFLSFFIAVLFSFMFYAYTIELKKMK
jgi:hypothetical protein